MTALNLKYDRTKCSAKCHERWCALAVPRCIPVEKQREMARRIDEEAARSEKARNKPTHFTQIRRERRIEETIAEAAEADFERITGFEKRRSR